MKNESTLFEKGQPQREDHKEDQGKKIGVKSVSNGVGYANSLCMIVDSLVPFEISYII